jgi:COP9 signalosome complex subunit 1
VDLHRMAAAFNTAVPSLEDELTQLILDGQISARIDSNAKVNWNSRTQAIPVTVSETFA